jgi:hypothetical protein
MTSAPAAFSSFRVAAPIPAAAPVTTIFRPANVIRVSLVDDLHLRRPGRAGC